MAEEKKKDAKPVDAVSSPRQDDGTASVRQQDGAKPVDANICSRQKEDGASSDGRDQKIASTGEATSKPLQEESLEKPSEPAQPAEPAKSAEPDPAPTKDSAVVDWKDLYARLRADFDNFKKRTARDREDTYRYAESDILKDILPTVDNLALALANATVDANICSRQKEDGASSDGRDQKIASTAFVKGVQLVYDNLLKSLKDHGAEPFDCVRQALDTEKMEAIATLPSATVAEGLVSNEVKRGWLLKGKVLRAAQVVVSSGSGS